MNGTTASFHGRNKRGVLRQAKKVGEKVRWRVDRGNYRAREKRSKGMQLLKAVWWKQRAGTRVNVRLKIFKDCFFNNACRANL